MGRSSSDRMIQAGILIIAIGILYAVRTQFPEKPKGSEGFQQEIPLQCAPGTELRLEAGMCCPFGIVDVANCWLKPKCPEPAFWDAERLACMTNDPNRDPYMLGFPMCLTQNASGKGYTFNLDQRKCCDPTNPRSCDTHFQCYKSRWDEKRGYCIGKDPRFTALGDAIAASVSAVPGTPVEKTDMTLVWMFGALTAVVLGATVIRQYNRRS